MGNTQSKLAITLGLSALYFVAYSTSAVITLVCLFGIPRAHQVQVVVEAAAPPTIALDGATVSNMGILGPFATISNAKLSSDGTKVLLAESAEGPVLAEAAPYSFIRRGNTAGSSICTFDGLEVSSPVTSRVFCRAFGSSSATFFAFMLWDLSNIRSGSSNPLYVSSGTTLGSVGMIHATADYLFVSSSNFDGRFYRLDLSVALTYTGTASTTLNARDNANGMEQYKFGACESSSTPSTAHCYVLSTNKKLAKFMQAASTVGSGTVPLHSSTISLSGAGMLDSGSVGDSNSIVIDTTNNVLFAATTTSSFIIAKVSLATFTFASRVVLTGGSNLYLCDNCFTSSNAYMMVITRQGLRDTRFIEVDSMTELTDASSFIGTSDLFASASWIGGSGRTQGALITEGDGVRKITIGVAPTPAPPTPAPPTTPSPPTTSATSATTTTTTSAPPLGPGGNNNQQQQQEEKSTSQGVIIGASIGSLVGVIAIVGGLVFVYYKFIKTTDDQTSSPDSSSPSPSEIKTTSNQKDTADGNNNGNELKEVKTENNAVEDDKEDEFCGL